MSDLYDLLLGRRPGSSLDGQNGYSHLRVYDWVFAAGGVRSCRSKKPGNAA
jgi:hypothetical protein